MGMGMFILGLIGLGAQATKEVLTPRSTTDQTIERMAREYYPSDMVRREQFMKEMGHSKFKK